MNDSNAPLAIGMIGCGFMGLTYSEALAKHVRGARLAAVRSSDHCGRV